MSVEIYYYLNKYSFFTVSKCPGLQKLKELFELHKKDALIRVAEFQKRSSSEIKGEGDCGSCRLMLTPPLNGQSSEYFCAKHNSDMRLEIEIGGEKMSLDPRKSVPQNISYSLPNKVAKDINYPGDPAMAKGVRLLKQFLEAK